MKVEQLNNFLEDLEVETGVIKWSRRGTELRIFLMYNSSLCLLFDDFGYKETDVETDNECSKIEPKEYVESVHTAVLNFIAACNQLKNTIERREEEES